MERGFRPFRTQPEKHLADRADRIEITLVEGNILQERRELRTIQADSGCNIESASMFLKLSLRIAVSFVVMDYGNRPRGSVESSVKPC